MAQVLVAKACSVHQNRQGSWKGRLVFHSIIAGMVINLRHIGHEKHMCWYYIYITSSGDDFFPCHFWIKRSRRLESPGPEDFNFNVFSIRPIFFFGKELMSNFQEGL